MSAGRPKALLKQQASKGKKKKEMVLNDADDYLEAANEHEDAMGKHRGGDAAKSLRFAHRALDVYAQGLERFPDSFDLAYNRARLELEVATHPALAGALDVPAMELLRRALASHQQARALSPDNTDTIFNTAQVLITMAEHMAEEDDGLPADHQQGPAPEALQALQHALAELDLCFGLQRKSYEQSRRDFEQALREDRERGAGEKPAAEVDDEGKDKKTDDDKAKDADANDNDGDGNGDDDDDDDEGQWATIVEPVTATTLVDTILLQVQTLTTMCSIMSSMVGGGGYDSAAGSDTELATGCSRSWVESYSANILNDVLPSVLAEERRDLVSGGGGEDGGKGKEKEIEVEDEEEEEEEDDDDEEDEDSDEDDDEATIKDRLPELALARASFTGALAELALRTPGANGDMDADAAAARKAAVDAAFAHRDMEAGSLEVLMAHARSGIALAGALADLDASSPSSSPAAAAAAAATSPSPLAALRWSTLVQAQARLTAASKLPGAAAGADAAAAAQTHALRGDVSLMLQVLSYAPARHEQAAASSAALLKHAEVYYRNAGKLFGTVAGGEGREEKEVCELKGAVVRVVQQASSPSSSSSSSSGVSVSGAAPGVGSVSRDQLLAALGDIGRAKGELWVKDQIEIMVGEGLVRAEVLGL